MSMDKILEGLKFKVGQDVVLVTDQITKAKGNITTVMTSKKEPLHNLGQGEELTLRSQKKGLTRVMKVQGRVATINYGALRFDAITGAILDKKDLILFDWEYAAIHAPRPQDTSVLF